MAELRKKAYLTEGEILELKNFVANLKKYRRSKKSYDAKKLKEGGKVDGSV